jgi:hypothetical protein
MEQEDFEEFIDTLKANLRGHADYFSWESNREVKELGVVRAFYESLVHYCEPFFHSYEARGRGNDPPDCEALSCKGGRIGIEVTELVEGDSIAAAKSGSPVPWEPFPKSHLYDLLAERIAEKDSPRKVKGGPYDEYVLVIYCDEPRVLDYGLIEYVRGTSFPGTKLLNRAFLLFSFSPWEGCCPYIELKLNGV